jgi:FlaA1/EpsC-like NDP-sugar epimerase
MAKTKMKKCIIVGAGTYGQVYAKYLSEGYDIVGYVDDNTDLLDREIYGNKVLGTVDTLFQPERFDLEVTCVFVPIGENQEFWISYPYIHPFFRNYGFLGSN